MCTNELFWFWIFAGLKGNFVKTSTLKYLRSFSSSLNVVIVLLQNLEIRISNNFASLWLSSLVLLLMLQFNHMRINCQNHINYYQLPAVKYTRTASVPALLTLFLLFWGVYASVEWDHLRTVFYNEVMTEEMRSFLSFTLTLPSKNGSYPVTLYLPNGFGSD